MEGHIVPPFDSTVGLFPLPNVVLLPGATLPLQIHEPRYRRLVRDALADNSLLAMAHLLPGYEPYYHTLMARIHPVVCVGLIREYAQISDGRYFLNLVGICRAKVSEEDRSGEYRVAHLEEVATEHTNAAHDGEFAAAQLCRQILYGPMFDGIAAAQQLRKICGNSMSLEQLVDLLAAGLLPADSVEIRQLILSESNVVQRAEILISELLILAKSLQAKRSSAEDELPGSMMN